MQEERKYKTQEKKQLDKKYRDTLGDDDFKIKKAKKKQFKHKKQQLFDDDSLEELKDYEL